MHPHRPLFVHPASQHCRSIRVYPTSWSQPKSDLPLVIQLLYPAGLHSLGLLVGGTDEDGSAAWSKITVILHCNSTELKIKPIRKTRGSCYVISSCSLFFSPPLDTNVCVNPSECLCVFEVTDIVKPFPCGL